MGIIQRNVNQTSKYTGVSWHRNNKKYFGGLFDKEEQAAMGVNLLCDKIGKERENQIDMKEDAMQQVSNKTSQYIGVSWHKKKKKWESRIRHNKKLYNGGYFDNEEQAAMKVNLLCDKYEIDRKNPNVIIKPNAIQQVSN